MHFIAQKTHLLKKFTLSSSNNNKSKRNKYRMPSNNWIIARIIVMGAFSKIDAHSFENMKVHRHYPLLFIFIHISLVELFSMHCDKNSTKVIDIF